MYTFLSAEEKHIDAILDIERLCFSTPFTREQLLSQLPDDRHAFIVAENGAREVLGYVGMMHVLDEGYIANVAVHPEHRRQGIADALISELKTAAKRLELSFVTLEVRESNEPARELYRKHGFSDVGIRKNYYTLPTENAILMTCFLR